MNEILNIGEPYVPVITPDTLAYLTFAYADQPARTIYNYVTKEIISTTVDKTTTNSILPGELVGQFTGTQSINFETPQSLGYGDFTLEAWIRITSGSAVYMVLSNANNSSGTIQNPDRISIGSNAGVLYTPTRYGSNWNTTARIPLNAWNHICVQRKSQQTRAFLNGVLANTFTHDSGITPTLFCLGAYLQGTRRFFTGLIAEAAVSKAARYDITGFTPTYPLFNR